MDFKSFEYRRKDISLLNKDTAIRVLFAFIFCAILIWQITILTFVVLKNTLTLFQLISSCIVIFICFMFALSSILIIRKNNRTVNVIKVKGKCVNSVNILFDSSKTGFMYLYSIVMRIITVLSLIVLAISLTYSVLEAKVFASTSYYLPLLVSFCFTGLYSSHNISRDISIAKTVDEFNKIY